MSSSSSTVVGEKQYSTALSHARELENRKRLQSQVLDMIIEAVDLPSKQTSDPAHPSAFDATCYKKSLSFFQPSDYDDLVRERNIYDKCGYGLCPRPNIREATTATSRIIWGRKGGQDFKVVPKAELEKWCSKECAERALFVRLQLSKEPVWIRGFPVENIKLLNESRDEAASLSQRMEGLNMQGSTSDFTDDLHKLAIEQGVKSLEQDDVADRLQALSLERGERQRRVMNAEGKLQIFERSDAYDGHIALQPRDDGGGMIAGYRPRKVRFASQGNSDEEDDDMDV